jgi:hypothetical protein
VGTEGLAYNYHGPPCGWINCGVLVHCSCRGSEIRGGKFQPSLNAREWLLIFAQLFIGVMSALYSVWDIVSLPHHCFLLRLLTSVTVRRSDSPQSKRVRCQCLCPEIWRLFSVLGSHVVHCVYIFHGCRYHCWYSCIPRVKQPTENGLWQIHPNSLKRMLFQQNPMAILLGS